MLCQTGNWSGGRNKRHNKDLTNNINNVSKGSSGSTDEAVSVEVSNGFLNFLGSIPIDVIITTCAPPEECIPICTSKEIVKGDQTLRYIQPVRRFSCCSLCNCRSILSPSE